MKKIKIFWIDFNFHLESEGTQPKQTTPVIRKRRNTQICSKRNLRSEFSIKEKNPVFRFE